MGFDNIPYTPTVHPRACGEQTVIPPMYLAEVHFSTVRRFIPAPAGNSPPNTRTDPHACGSSPRLRGTALSRHSTMRSQLQLQSVHPRACGEQEIQAGIPARPVCGSSPRLRGTGGLQGRDDCGEQGLSLRGCAVHPRACGERYVGKQHIVSPVIPAPAGNGSIPFTSVHPRACGER